MTDTEMNERKRHLIEQFHALAVEDVVDPGPGRDGGYVAYSDQR